MKKRFILAVCLGVISFSANLSAAPDSEVWQRWTVHDETADHRLDHSAWNRFLQAYVVAHSDGINRVAYGRISTQDRAMLNNYIDQMVGAPVSSLKREEQRAFWINLYNALTVKLVIDAYPVDSIRDIDISPGLFSNGPWGKKLISVEAVPVSLDDIEHRILRPIWQDPRIHYAVNCASLGCPNLQKTAFTANNTDMLLNKGAKEYINHPRGARIAGGELTVSRIYKWFQADFGGNAQQVIDHLLRHATPEKRQRLDAFDDINDYVYDWRLNDVGDQR